MHIEPFNPFVDHVLKNYGTMFVEEQILQEALYRKWKVLMIFYGTTLVLESRIPQTHFQGTYESWSGVVVRVLNLGCGSPDSNPSSVMTLAV